MKFVVIDQNLSSHSGHVFGPNYRGHFPLSSRISSAPVTNFGFEKLIEVYSALHDQKFLASGDGRPVFLDSCSLFAIVAVTISKKNPLF